MKNISQKGYTTDEIWAVLRGESGTRQVRFRYDVLDEYDNKKNELNEVISGSIKMSAFSEIKRTAKFSLREETMLKGTREEKKLIEFTDTKIGEL